MDVRDINYGIGYKYHLRVFVVEPKGVITVMSEKDYKVFCDKGGITIITQGKPVKGSVN
jgi:hypothetical protein